MKEVFDYILSIIKSRIFPLVMIFIILVCILVNRLFNLQIMNGESYVNNLSSSIQKKMSVTATRGRIFDKNGVLLAYNDLAYAVTISDSGTYSSTDVKNETINNSIEKTLNIIEENGDTFSNDFPIVYEDGSYSYNIESTTLLRFIRDSYGVSSINDLTDEQRGVSAEELFNYYLDKYAVSLDDYSVEHVLMIVNLRRYMSANSYNRYMSFVISNEVSDATMAAILENSGDLVGVQVEEKYIRRYTYGKYMSQILGYTGTVSTSELEELGDSYESNDVVGKSGIESSMESVLAGTKGSQTVYVDTVGRITEVISEEEATAGYDVYLTIDVNLQKTIYDDIEDELATILTSHLTSGTTKYTYDSDGDVEDIYITAQEVYYAFINNNLLSLSEIASSDSSVAQSVYQSFLSKKSEVLDWVKEELVSGNTGYSSLTSEQQSYIWYIYTMLKTEGVFDTSNVDTTDGTYSNWIGSDSTVSLQTLLTYGISQNWIDMSSLTDEQYTSLQESYDVLVDYIISALDTDSSFFKVMYEYLIEDGSVTGTQLSILLYEQGYLDPNAENSRYTELVNGSLSAYEFINYVISNKIITPGELALEPCSGSAVVTDPTSGDVLALVSYPSYDNNKLSGSVDATYYSQLVSDNASPLLNRATQSFIAPGSTYKPCSAIAGLSTGIISTSTGFYCSGSFDLVTPSPKCWRTSGHGTETVTTAIRDSCNVYFYNVGYQLAMKNGSYNSTYGTSILQNYSDMLGLSTSVGVEIEEGTPQASTTNAIASAIGQGNHKYSTLNLARYVTTLATSGTVYNLTLIDKITDSDGNIIEDNSAEVNNQVELDSSIWDAVHTGMQLAASTYTAVNALNLKIAAKTGTAQEKTTSPDHAQMISYAPYDNPEVCVAVTIQNGYTSSNAIALTSEIYKYYYGLE